MAPKSRGSGLGILVLGPFLGWAPLLELGKDRRVPRTYRRGTEASNQRRVKPLRMHRLVQKLVCPGADLAVRSARSAADEERWNFGRTAERAAELFDGVDSGQSSP
jgi:hypothetical protein